MPVAPSPASLRACGPRASFEQGARALATSRARSARSLAWPAMPGGHGRDRRLRAPLPAGLDDALLVDRERDGLAHARVVEGRLLVLHREVGHVEPGLRSRRRRRRRASSWGSVTRSTLSITSASPARSCCERASRPRLAVDDLLERGRPPLQCVVPLEHDLLARLPRDEREGPVPTGLRADPRRASPAPRERGSRTRTRPAPAGRTRAPGARGGRRPRAGRPPRPSPRSPSRSPQKAYFVPQVVRVLRGRAGARTRSPPRPRRRACRRGTSRRAERKVQFVRASSCVQDSASAARPRSCPACSARAVEDLLDRRCCSPRPWRARGPASDDVAPRTNRSARPWGFSHEPQQRDAWSARVERPDVRGARRPAR